MATGARSATTCPIRPTTAAASPATVLATPRCSSCWRHTSWPIRCDGSRAAQRQGLAGGGPRCHPAGTLSESGPISPRPATVLLRVTKDETAGAVLQVAGLRVIDRALRQLERTGLPRVVIASDGAIALPPRLPPGAEVRELPHGPGETAAALAVLEAELGQPPVLPADVVRVRGNRFDGGLRVS